MNKIISTELISIILKGVLVFAKHEDRVDWQDKKEDDNYKVREIELYRTIGTSHLHKKAN